MIVEMETFLLKQQMTAVKEEVLKDGDTDDFEQYIGVYYRTEGEDIMVHCYFQYSGERRVFCRNDCGDGDILVETTDDSHRRGRYRIDYYEGSYPTTYTLINVSIRNLSKSDSGRYSCWLDRRLSPDSLRTFHLNVTDEPPVELDHLNITEADQVNEEVREEDVLKDGDTDDFEQYISDYYVTEGEDIIVQCIFQISGERRVFCRNDCEDGDILVETTDDSRQRGRYRIDYYEESYPSTHTRIFVSIRNLRKSDSGRYSCWLDRRLSPDSLRTFQLIVTDVLKDGDTDDFEQYIGVYYRTEGEDIIVHCYFQYSGERRVFCRNDCEDGDILVETTDNSRQRGRYRIDYYEGRYPTTYTLINVSIRNLSKSDSGRYSCWLDRRLSPDSLRTFQLNVTDEPPVELDHLNITEADQVNEEVREEDVLKDGDTDDFEQYISDYYVTEGEEIRVHCFFRISGERRVFCRNDCGDGDILVETTDDSHRRGRYRIDYYKGSYPTPPVLINVSIRNLRKSDSGRYSCWLDRRLSPDSRVKFQLIVTDAPTPSASTLNTTLTTPTAASGVPLYVRLVLVVVFIGSSSAVLILCRKRRTSGPQEPPVELDYVNITEIQSKRNLNLNGLSEKSKEVCKKTLKDFFFLSRDIASLQDGNSCLFGPRGVKVVTGTIGGMVKMTCYFDYPETRRFFCRDGCKDGHVLLEDNGIEAQSGRYSMWYLDRGPVSLTPVYVSITNLTKSDSGRYSCFSGSVRSPHEIFEFEVKVKEAPTIPRPTLRPPRLFPTSASTQETTPPPASADQQPEPTWTPQSFSTSNPPSSTPETSLTEQDNEVLEEVSVKVTPDQKYRFKLPSFDTATLRSNPAATPEAPPTSTRSQ
ncbi:uncharacterized protein LOC114559275 [Xyrichtys novacula]|uniref:Uncharacterized protein LOC114559275 n=1 Tax=Xyrichtys novacula TaxID=13765 RepID=A0AAV1HIB0_XYRNO|nr:uncharacterized protein LOC114559275 [Xyrichtys novacula]